MKNNGLMMMAVLAIVSGQGVPYARAQSSDAVQQINEWISSSNDKIMPWGLSRQWTLGHAPRRKETVFFAGNEDIVEIVDKITLSNNMLIGGKSLTLQGQGCIGENAANKGLICIPAENFDRASLILRDKVLLNGNLALAPNDLGTPTATGTLTLHDNTSVNCSMTVGSNGGGSGRIFVYDHARLNIAGFELNTKKALGGAAEIYIEGGVVQINATRGQNPFELLCDDPSRRIIMGACGTLRIECKWSIRRQMTETAQLVSSGSLIPADNCAINPPEFQDGCILFTAERSNKTQKKKDLRDMIRAMRDHVENLDTVSALANESGTNQAVSEGAEFSKKDASATPSATQTAVNLEKSDKHKEVLLVAEKPAEQRTVPVAGYIVFFGIVLLLFRPSVPKQ